MHRTHQLQRPIAFIEPNAGDRQNATDSNVLINLWKTLDASKAQATIEADRVRILADIEKEGGVAALTTSLKALIVRVSAEDLTRRRKELHYAPDLLQPWISKHSQVLDAVGDRVGAQKLHDEVMAMKKAAQARKEEAKKIRD